MVPFAVGGEVSEIPWQSEVLLSHLDPPVLDRVRAVGDLEVLLSDLTARAVAAWPSLELPPETFLAHLASVLGARSQEDPAVVLREIPPGDLYLAAACASGDGRAIAAFREAHVPALRRSLRKLAAPDSVIDETEQQLFDMLFVARDRGAPQISTYSGRGQLRSWLRSIGVRTCRRLMGKEAAAGAGDDGLERVPDAVGDPEILHLKSLYREEFRSVFARALSTLSERERNLLRQHYIDGLTIDQLGKLYRVHRATAARWVARARRCLCDRTRRALVDELGVDTVEVDSIIRLVRSQLDVSIHELLG